LIQTSTDTVYVVQQQAGWQSWVDVLGSVATIVVAIALLMIGFGAIFAGLRVKKLMKMLEGHAQKLRVDLSPAIHHVTAVSENVDFMSRTVRKDVEKLSETVTSADRSLRRAAQEAERRAVEFNALLEVVQEEAEDLLLGGAAALRGAKVGAETFRRFRAVEAEDEEDCEVEDDWGEEDEVGEGWEDGEDEDAEAEEEPEPPPPARAKPRRKGGG
jgi:uncharacterized protein YoxC